MNHSNITVFAKWQVQQGYIDKVLELLTEVARQSQAEEGNLEYSIYQSNNDVNTLLLSEVYKDEAALAAHRASAHFQELVIGNIVPMLENREVIIANRLLLNDQD